MSVAWKFESLLGKTIDRVDGAREGSDEITIALSTGEKFRMYHDQDCCETVQVNDVCGDIADVIGSPILLAEEAVSRERPDDADQSDDSQTWTFYKLSTIKGSVTISWLGESNGYYSEAVDFEPVE